MASVRMAFLRIVEVLPPVFPESSSKDDHILVGTRMERFAEELKRIRDFADVFLLANVKNPRLLKLDLVQTAIFLQKDLRIRVAPVTVVRNQNRSQFLSTVLTGVVAGLDSMMIAWGDDLPASAMTSNVRDFPNLASAIREASLIRSRTKTTTRLLSPVDLDSLADARGVFRARERIKSGADLLLAQPPTTTLGGVFEIHASLILRAGLKRKVLPNVFHFHGEQDIRRYESMFGWKLPDELHKAAREGERGLIEEERDVVHRLRKEKFPGVYLSTRGRPEIARRLLS